jgi:hypothetical protein
MLLRVAISCGAVKVRLAIKVPWLSPEKNLNFKNYFLTSYFQGLFPFFEWDVAFGVLSRRISDVHSRSNAVG